PLSFAYVGGLNVHTSTDNFNQHLNSKLGNYDPDAYLDGLNLTDLGINSTWASWVYDNPGIDTDSDGYAGKYRVCPTADSTIFDTIWYEGDGVPDFQGATPPPPPSLTMRVEPSVGKIKVRWNGRASETTKDIFSRVIDFEGYRVWLARDDRPTSYSMLASYDIQDYNKFVFSPSKGDFVLRETPFSLDSLRMLYAPGGQFDSTWNPLDFTRGSPFILPGFPDSIFYFGPQDFNRSRLGIDTDIKKTYPNAPKPPLSWTLDDVPLDSLDIYLTPDHKYFKYYEYEYTIENLLPTVPYWVNVTAFDFGSPQSGLSSLETSKTVLPANTFALETVDSVAAKDLPIYVYPNPYRLDAAYRARGFEGTIGEQRDLAA
ncbi:MAG: hypothetical protein D6800_12155, partial [Candidatus Zixiibacteriota bacterium]